MAVIGGGVATSNRRGLGESTGRVEGARAVCGSGLGGQAGGLAGITLQAFQHG
jgi:hypothetical protein